MLVSRGMPPVTAPLNGVQEDDPLGLDDIIVTAPHLPALTAADALAPPPAPPAPPPAFVPGAPLVLAPSDPVPPKTRGKAKDVAAGAFRATLLEEGGGADVRAPVEPYDLPPAMTEAEIASLHEAAEEVTLEGEIGTLTLVRAYTGQERKELTYRDAAALRTIVQIFPARASSPSARPHVLTTRRSLPLTRSTLRATRSPRHVLPTDGLTAARSSTETTRSGARFVEGSAPTRAALCVTPSSVCGRAPKARPRPPSSVRIAASVIVRGWWSAGERFPRRLPRRPP